MRHSRATHKAGFDDVERPLTARGRRDAAAAGSWLRDQDLTPDLVLCSPSCRTRQTWDELAVLLGAAPVVPAGSAIPVGSLGETPPASADLAAPQAAGAGRPGAVEVWYDSRLYLADDYELREIIAETP